MRPSWRDRQYRELKKLLFSTPRKCPIDIFGLLAYSTILNDCMLHSEVVLASILHAASWHSTNLQAVERRVEKVCVRIAQS